MSFNAVLCVQEVLSNFLSRHIGMNKTFLQQGTILCYQITLGPILQSMGAIWLKKSTTKFKKFLIKYHIIIINPLKVAICLKDGTILVIKLLWALWLKNQLKIFKKIKIKYLIIIINPLKVAICLKDYQQLDF